MPINNFLSFIFGPRLYRIHNTVSGHVGAVGQNYTPNVLEEHTQKILSVIASTKTVLYYTIPIWTIMLFRRGYFTMDYAISFTKYSVIVYLGLLLLRGFGRMQNQDYVDFVTVLEDAKSNDNGRKRNYDFDFRHWPIDFKADQSRDEKKPIQLPPYHLTGRIRKVREEEGFMRLPVELMCFIVAHGFGLSMVYPGSTALLNAIIGPALQDGRNKLVEQHGGKRAKLETLDGNFIDCMYVDRRQREVSGIDSPDHPSNILVIGCEGNAGFYEVGVMVTPLDRGYSVLGWNHPGFGASTGTPFPAAEINAIDTVIQYAIVKLNFQPENILIFGWSIGAFTALNAAAAYPGIRGLFIDATFDDVVPLATKAMPRSFEGLVKRTMRGYINLNHGELIKQYSGPVHFVRRQMDEVMNIDGQRVVSSNCGNTLLYHFLLHRYPQLFGSTEEEKILIKQALTSWLHREDNVMRTSVLSDYKVEDTLCEVRLRSYLEKNSNEFPIGIGEELSLETKQQLVLYLANKHMSHLDSSHCTPLPATLFVKPWDIKDLGDNSSAQYSSSDDFELINGNNDQSHL